MLFILPKQQTMVSTNYFFTRFYCYCVWKCVNIF